MTQQDIIGYSRIMPDMFFTKKGWIVIDDPLKPLEQYNRSERPIGASIKRFSELTGHLPGAWFELEFRQGGLSIPRATRKEQLAISEDCRSFLNLPDNFTGTVSACITDNFGFTNDSGNRPALMAMVANWQKEEISRP